LVIALSNLSDNNIVSLSDAMDNFSTSIDEVIEKLSVGENIKWEIDLERTSCHLGTDSEDNCNVCSKNFVSENLIFVSKDKVDVTVSCVNSGKKITTKTKFTK
jgi:hypothetical protein